jgi:enoyl-CoA hydratase/carnithine racemase
VAVGGTVNGGLAAGNEPGAVAVERRGSIAVLVLNRPDAANALDRRLLAELDEAVGQLSGDRSVQAVIVTGAGRHFSAGADLREDHRQRRASRERFGAAIDMSRLPQPVIAALNGAAVGGGCELALSCDFRFMSEEARIGLPEIRFGALPLGGGTARLPRIVGLAWAKRMIMTGDLIDAQMAGSIGLADEVVPAGELLERAEQFALSLAGRAGYALRAAKSLVNSALDTDLQTALAHERLTVKSMASPGERAAERRRAAAQQQVYARIFAPKAAAAGKE